LTQFLPLFVQNPADEFGLRDVDADEDICHGNPLLRYNGIGAETPLGDNLVIFEIWAQAYRPSSVREKRPVLTTSSWLKIYLGLSVPLKPQRFFEPYLLAGSSFGVSP